MSLTRFDAPRAQSARVALGAETLVGHALGVLRQPALVQRPIDRACEETRG